MRLATRGSLTIDLNGELGDGGAPAGYAARFDGDGLHPNQAGQDHIASLLKPMLATILAAAARRAMLAVA